MGYRLAEQNGESVAVPRLVFAHLARADGDTIRAALYLLGSIGPVPGCWSVTGMRPCPKPKCRKLPPST